jgi:hypothetical protein
MRASVCYRETNLFAVPPSYPCQIWNWNETWIVPTRLFSSLFVDRFAAGSLSRSNGLPVITPSGLTTTLLIRSPTSPHPPARHLTVYFSLFANFHMTAIH